MKNFILLLLAGALTLASCGKDDPADAGSITLDKNTISLKRGGSETLTATLLPGDATDKSVAWSCDKPEIATVDASGKVSAVNSGFATVTATAGGKSAACAVTVEPDVYVVGCSHSDASLRKGILWKNGVVQEQLPFSDAQSVYVDGGDIYVCGTYQDNDGMYASGYWENGILHKLFTQKIGGNSVPKILVSDGNVYVAGWGRYDGFNNAAFLWINGIPKQMETTGNSAAYNLCISDGVQYVCGNRTKNNISCATYWKNGVATELTDGTFKSVIRSMEIDNGTVYAVGQRASLTDSEWTAVLWTDGKMTDLPGGTVPSDVRVSDKGDVYIIGSNNVPEALLWKNGEPTILATNAKATSVALFGNDVYVTGQLEGQAVVWKNGIPTILPGGVFALSVFLY